MTKPHWERDSVRFRSRQEQIIQEQDMDAALDQLVLVERPVSEESVPEKKPENRRLAH